MLVVALVMTFGLAAASGQAASGRVTAGASTTTASLTGVVRDMQGMAQAGALIEVMAAGLDTPRTAFTDIHGRYTIPNLAPGRYAVQASATLYVSATKAGQLLRPGRWSVVNLTLASMFDTSVWLPAERRRADEPGDDWKWTLRASANRPMLRMVDDSGPVLVSSSATEVNHSDSQVRESFRSGDGGFGRGGAHNILAQNHELGEGSDVLLRLDVGLPTGLLGVAPSTELETGFERRLGFAGASRTVVSYQQHPEIFGSGTVAGLSAFQMASAQQTSFGDTVKVEYGGAIYAVKTVGTAATTAPFVRIMVQPTENWTVGYRMATAEDLQGFDDLNTIERQLPTSVSNGGTPILGHGRHQEVSVRRKLGHGVVQAALYHDSMDHPVVSGGGAIGYLSGSAALSGAALAALTGASGIGRGYLTDGTTDTFQFLGPGYNADGWNVMVSEPIGPAMWAAVEYSSGSALAGSAHGLSQQASRNGLRLASTGVHRSGSLADAGFVSNSNGLQPRSGQAVAFAIKGRIVRSGTGLRASYRWQPTGMVTAIDPYRAFSDQAYLSFSLRQPIHLGRMLPPGLEGMVDVSNLLAEGYQPFLSADGGTLFLAQAPRTIEGGLSLTF